MSADPFPNPFETATTIFDGSLPQVAVTISTDANLLVESLGARVEGGIALPGDDVTISACAAELFRSIAKTRKLFTQGRRIVSLAGDGRSGVSLELLEPDAARSFFERFTKFFKRTNEKGRECVRSANLSNDCARALLASHEAREILPEIRALSAVPVVKQTGEIHASGWDEQSGIFVTAKPNAGFELPSLPDAVAKILETQIDFRFVAEADKSRAIAAIIAPAIRLSGAINGSAPLHTYEADQSQTGKGYQTKLIGAIYGEILSPVTMSGPRGVGSFDEAFNTALLKGRPIVVLDNLRDKLNSQALESFLTCESLFSCRALRTCGEVDSKKYVLYATSNGMQGTTDIANRMLVVRLLKQKRDYKFHRYAEGDLVSHIVANRSAFIGAVLRIVSEWIKRGKPTTDESRHDLREWCQPLDWITQNIFKLPPLLDGHDDARQRIADPGLSFIRNLCLTFRDADMIGGALVYNASQIAAQAAENDISIPGLPPSRQGDDSAAAKAVGVSMSRLFKEEDSISVDRWSVRREVERIKRNDGTGYYDSKTYRFSAVSP